MFFSDNSKSRDAAEREQHLSLLLSLRFLPPFLFKKTTTTSSLILFSLAPHPLLEQFTHGFCRRASSPPQQNLWASGGSGNCPS
jgi:hypothetical protein